MSELTIPPGSGDVILGYVRGKAAAWTTAQVLERVRDALAKLDHAALAVPEADLEVVPAGEGWSPLFCIRHVAEINVSTARRCAEAVSPGDAPFGLGRSWQALSRAEALEAQAAALWSAFTTIAEGSASLADAVPRTWAHPFLGELTWPEWLLTLHVHSLAHADQLADMTRSLSFGAPHNAEKRP